VQLKKNSSIKQQLYWLMALTPAKKTAFPCLSSYRLPIFTTTSQTMKLILMKISEKLMF